MEQFGKNIQFVSIHLIFRPTIRDALRASLIDRSMVQEYFKSIFTRDNNLNPEPVIDLFEPVVTDVMDEKLCAEFSEKEIADGLFQIGLLKAPGSDGLPARFFQRNWGIFKEEVVRAVREFFRTGIMPEGVNDAIIVLILKTDEPQRVNDFRPISLCNVIYKIVAKCLVNRLRPILDEIDLLP